MPRTLQELEAEALQLPVEARGQLVARLLESLEPSDAEIQQLWIHEAERRADELRSGQVRSEPLEEVFTRIRAKLA
jgi:putative addiction module component (TIGR02574 family)